MRKTDKNIVTATLIIIIGLLVWSVTRYNAVKEENSHISDENTPKENVSEFEEDSLDDTSQNSQSVIPLITAQDLNSKIMRDIKNTTVIDMRSVEAFAAGHIKGSHHINDASLLTMQRDIVLVTDTGNEDTIMSYYRDIAGNNSVSNLQGGIAQWRNAGFALLTLNTEQTFANVSKVQFVEPRDIDAAIKDIDGMKKTIILDTRRPGNFESGHVTGAINIPLSELEYRSDELPNGHKIYVYGANETASFQSGALLHDLNLINVKTMKGGFEAWEKYSYPVVK